MMPGKLFWFPDPAIRCGNLAGPFGNEKVPKGGCPVIVVCHGHILVVANLLTVRGP